MKAFISLADVDSIKAELTRLLPNVKSSHRVEAMARGLGWNTNAALRAELVNSQAERVIDNHEFTDYLAQHGFTGIAYDALAEAVVRCKFPTARADIEAVMAQAPQLTHFGFGVFDARKKTPEQHRAEIAEGRQGMLTAGAVYAFILAREFLARRGQRATINNSSSSYGLKHQAERTYSEYISNGMLIAAAIHLGLKIKRDGPNAYFNIASQRAGASNASRARPAPARLASYIGGKARKTAWRNMMVAAINEGLDQGAFGLEADDNRWTGDHHIYHFEFFGFSAIARVRDAGFGELSINVAVNPTTRAEEHITSWNAGLYAGEAFAHGYMERRNGKWLKTSDKPCNAFRRDILPIIAQATVTPKGFTFKEEGILVF